MANQIWIGGAPSVAQVDLVTLPDDIESGQVVSFTIGVQTLEVTLSETVLADIVTELVTAWNASTIPEFAEITAAAGSVAGTLTLTADTAGKYFGVTVSIGTGSNEVQVVTLGGTTATGGTFTLTYSGQTTGNIAYNASAATVDAALEALSNIGAGDVTVTGTGPWTVEFTGALAATNVSLMTIDVSGLTGGANEVQTISTPNNSSGGTFTLTYGSQTTAAIAYNASAATIETALEALTNIPSGSVTCGGGPLPADVTVTFSDELGYQDVDLLVADASSLTGITGSAAETTAGGSTLKDKTEYYWAFETEETGEEYNDSVGASVLDADSGNSLTHGATGIIGNAIHYPGGSNDYLEGASGAHSKALTGDFSVSAWVKYDTALAGNSRIILGNSNASSVNYHLRLNADATFKFALSGTTYEVDSVATATVDTWHHVCGVYDSVNNLVKISIDGAAFVTSAASVATNEPSSSYLRVGGGTQSGLTFYEGWKGYIDSVGIYDSALSIGEVGSLYNSGAGDDYPFPSAGDNEVQTLTLAGSPSTGSVVVSYQGVGVSIPYDATASEAETLLDSVSTIGAGNVNVTGGAWPGTALIVEFINDLAVTNVEMLEIDVSSLVMLLTETTKGVSIPTGTVATTVTPITTSTTTSSSGPNNWDVASNWSTNSVPVNGDIVYIGDTTTSILYGLDQSAVTLAELHVEQTFTGAIGLPRNNGDGTSAYFEYRDSYLQVGATLLFIGAKDGDGSERVKIDLGSVQSTVLITDSGTSADANTPAILLLGTHASNVVNINRGTLGIAYYPTEVSTIATLRQAFYDSPADDTTVHVGAGVTLTDVKKSGGELDLYAATTTLEQTEGETTIHSGAHAAITIVSGTLNYNSSGTLTTVSVTGDAVLNFDQDRRPKTVTTINKNSDDSLIKDNSSCIASPVINMNNVDDLGQLEFGNGYTVTIT